MRIPTLLLMGLMLGLAGCGNSSRGKADAVVTPGGGTPTLPAPVVAESQLATCVAKSPHLQVGNGLDAPGRLEADHAPGAEPRHASHAPCPPPRVFRVRRARAAA